MTERRGFLARIAGLVGLTVIERGSPPWFQRESMKAAHLMSRGFGGSQLPLGEYKLISGVRVMEGDPGKDPLFYITSIEVVPNAVPNKESENQ